MLEYGEGQIYKTYAQVARGEMGNEDGKGE